MWIKIKKKISKKIWIYLHISFLKIVGNKINKLQKKEKTLWKIYALGKKNLSGGQWSNNDAVGFPSQSRSCGISQEDKIAFNHVPFCRYDRWRFDDAINTIPTGKTVRSEFCVVAIFQHGHRMRSLRAETCTLNVRHGIV